MSVTSPLAEAIEVLGARGKEHGDFFELHTRIAQLWSAFLDRPIAPSQVAALMALLKLARSEANPSNDDNIVDLAGYAAIYGELLKLERLGSPLPSETRCAGGMTPGSSETR